MSSIIVAFFNLVNFITELFYSNYYNFISEFVLATTQGNWQNISRMKQKLSYRGNAAVRVLSILIYSVFTKVHPRNLSSATTSYVNKSDYSHFSKNFNFSEDGSII